MSRNFLLVSCFICIFSFLNVESIRGFTSTFVDVLSSTSYPSGFPSRSKLPTLETLKFIVTTLRNQYKKVSFICVGEDGSLARSSESVNTCHNMNIIFQNKNIDVSSLNGKIEIPNKTLANITIVLLLNSSHRKELCCFSYQYAICISRRT